MHYTLVDTKSALIEMLDILKKQDCIAIDTEFDRRKTFFAILSLVQIATSTDLIIIDVIKIGDISALEEILTNNNIIKIFHDGRQDVEMFYQLFGKLPANIFDSQIAAKFCGYGPAPSYARLCQDICNVNIDKTLQATNWLARPLTRDMILYLVKDVKYLRIIYKHLNFQLNTLNRIYAYSKVIQDRYHENIFAINFDKAYNKIKIPKDLNATEIEQLKLFASIREKIAVEENIPRQHIVKNNTIITLIKYGYRDTITAMHDKFRSAIKDLFLY